MALRVWLPLNGNLENQGLSGEASISGSPSYASGGKIADKYLNTGNMISIHAPTIKGSKVCTFSFWAYVVSSTITSDWTLIARIDDQGTNAGSNMRFEVCPKSNYNGIYCFSNHNNGNYGLTNGCIASPVGGYYDQWVHFCFTSDGTTFTRYMNGVKIGTCAYNGEATFNGDFRLANNNKCYKQDVRIYDHCLSPKEVKEISKGLCLHYKLTGPGQENLIKDGQLPIFNYGGGGTWCTFTKSIVDDNGLCCRFDCTATGVGGKYYYPDGVDITAWAGQIFTWSFEAKANKNIIFQAGHERGGVINITITPQWTTFSKTWTFTSSGNYAFIMYPGTNISVGDWFEVRNIKIEKGSIATSWCPNPADTLYGTLGYNNNIEDDCSGYCHNGAKGGTITCDSDSPRYATSYKFNTGIDYIKSAFSLSMSELSCSFWVKPNSSNGGYSIIASNYNNPPSGFWLAINTEGSGVWFYNGAYVAGGSLLTNDIWHHCVFTFKNGIGTWHVNGTSVVSINISNRGASLNINNLTVGNSYTGTSWNTKNYGQISDIRLYATALSDADIKELYNTSASIDNMGNMHAYEYREI